MGHLGLEKTNYAMTYYDLKSYIDNNPDSKALFVNYLRKIWVKFSSLSLGDILAGSVTDDSNVSLPAVYTALDTEAEIFVNRTGSVESEGGSHFIPSEDSHLSRRLQAEAINRGRMVVKSHPRLITVLEMLEYYPRLVLIGPAGSGKSTFTQFMTLCMAGEILEKEEANLRILNGDVPPGIPEPWPHGALLPIHVDLKLFVRSEYFPSARTTGTAGHLLDYIDSSLRPEQDPNIRSFLQSGTIGTLLMLDGLDEVPKAEKCRERIREIITDLTGETCPSCRILVTSRPHAYGDPAWRLDHAGFHETQLAKLNTKQMENFVLHWYWQLKEFGRVAEHLWEERAGNLNRGIKRQLYLREMASNPLLLTMIVIVNEWGGSTEYMNRSDLYEESTKLLLDRWNQRRGLDYPAISDVLGTGTEILRKKIEELAFTVHREQEAAGDTGHITYERLSAALGTIHTNIVIPIEEIMDYLHERSGILVADGPSLFRFPHRSFQEFLTACYLIQSDDYSEVARLATRNPGLWREVLLFMAWRAKTFRYKDVWDLASELCPRRLPGPRPSEAEWWGALFAGLIIAETNLHQEDTSQHQIALEPIRAWLQACVQRGAMSIQERVEVGRILGYIGDPRPGVVELDDGRPRIEWIDIAAGSFLRGSATTDESALGNERPQEKIMLEAFRISKYPITVAQFQAYVESGDCSIDLRAKKQRQWQEKPDYYIANHPVVGVTPEDAIGFCQWLGSKLGYEVRLPTEDEWEKAARGASGRIYPWGAEFSSNLCNVKSTEIGRTCAVGIFPDGDSPNTVTDMAGNVWEWCTKTHPLTYGPSIPIYGDYVVRGGAFYSPPSEARCAFRSPGGTEFWEGQGFRIVTSVLYE